MTSGLLWQASRIVLVFSVGYLPIVATAGAQLTQEQAFNEGKTAGSETKRQDLFDSLTDTKGAAVIKGYDPNARPAGAAPYSDNVIGTLTSGGSTKIGNCGSGNAGGTDQPSVQHCEAVNAVNQQSTMPAQNIIPANDPLLAKANAIRSNPEAIAGSFVNSYTGCTTTTVTTPGASVVQTCNDYGQLGTETCTTGTSITLDPDYFYKCLETIQTPASSSCTVGRTIVIDADTNYQCNRTDQGVKSQSCTRTAVVTIEFTGNAGWLCPNPGAAMVAFTMRGPKWGDRYPTYLYCTTTPNTYRVVVDRYYGMTLYPAENTGTVYGSRNVSRYSCKASELWASISCSGTACTLSVTYKENSWIVDGNNKKCVKAYPDQASASSGFTAARGTPSAIPKVTWQDNCGQLEAASR
jgi:hypothetical protein